MFIDPLGEYNVLNAPLAVFMPSEYFQLSAKVQVDFNSKYDAGVLILYANESQWAKLSKILSGQAIFAAKLLAGQMPEYIEDAFEEPFVD